MEALAAPSPLLSQQWDALRAAAARGPVVELACGRGRIACAVAERGIRVVGIDRSAAHLGELRERALQSSLPITPLRADLETGAGLPLAPASCGVLLVFRYLHRPLAAKIERALVPGGLLLYETFTVHQRDLGHGPSNPAFLLQEGELAGLVPALETLASWEGLCEQGRPAALARLAARRPANPDRL